MNTSDVAGNYLVSSISHFTPIDYLVFGMLLICSTAIGLYFGCFNKREQTTEEYLHGGHKMHTFPIAVSLITSLISAFTIVVIPAEVYSFGWICSLPYPLTMLLLAISANYLFLPVYHQSGIDNCYVYLELRFSRTMRYISTLAWLVQVVLYMPIIMYLPSLAFAEVTGHNIHSVNTIVCYCCVIYTLLGGIKAVVWTDVIQGAVMILSMVLIISYGMRDIGGLTVAWNRAVDGGRVFVPNFDVDITTRNTFWNTLLGLFIIWTSNTTFNQSFAQRILSLPTLSHSRRAVFTFAIGAILIKTLSFITAIIMYEYYYGCDPVQSKIIDKTDKLVPRFVQDVVGHINGMPGMFISCLFSASLSTVSANLNSFSGVLYMDFIRPANIIRHTDKNANRIMKLIVFFTGSFIVLGVWAVEKVPSSYQTVVILEGMVTGSTFGVFSLGMLYPWANRHGALYGVLISMVVMGFIVTNAQIATVNGLLKYDSLPSSIEECDIDNTTATFHQGFTNTTEIRNETAIDNGFALYKIAFLWYGPLGMLITWIFGIIISHFTGGQDLSQLDLNLISPGIKYLLPKKYRHTQLEMDATHSKVHDNNRGSCDGFE